jgi:nitrite reductase (NADH) large subunit
MAKHIIIGNSVAANAAAEKIRATDKQCSILMFSKEKVPFYYVPALPEFLAGEKDISGIIIHNEQWYTGNGIELHLDTEVTAIDPKAKNVTTKEGASFSYDTLLLATGGYSFIPPIPGSKNEGVVALRTAADAQAIKKRAETAKELVLIGGGVLGLEAGNGLRKAGLKVSVVEVFPRLLPRQMDAPGAAILQSQMEKMGFSFYLGAKTRDITSEGGKLFVNLEGGEKLPADMVMISAGVRPEVSLAKALGLEIDKGVKVDDSMITGMADIYAAGDLIEHRGMFYGLWQPSMDQGRVAGTNMAGGSAQYGGSVMANSLKVVGINLTAGGDIDADAKLESIVVQDAAMATYRKFVVQDNKLVGTILLGDNHGADDILAAIKSKKDISALKADLAKPDFDCSRL